MAFTLEDSWTKLARGKEHLDTVARECEEYLSAAPAITAEVVRDPEAGTMIGFSAHPAPPARIGAIVGDFAHNLRSALDVAAWQLAIANDEDAARKTPNLVTFPLTHSSDEFEKPHRALRFFSESALGLIERLQPYHANMDALGWLRTLSNSDKHRVATFSLPGLTGRPTEEAGVTPFSGLHVLFGTDEGQLGLMGLQAITASVEAALQQIEEGFAQG
jgi:hypothetical protein